MLGPVLRGKDAAQSGQDACAPEINLSSAEFEMKTFPTFLFS
jgi:hypothetical protein